MKGSKMNTVVQQPRCNLFSYALSTAETENIRTAETDGRCLLIYRLFSQNTENYISESGADSDTLENGGGVYSVAVVMLDSESGRTEADTAFDIARGRDEADEIFEAIADGSVPPDTLHEVLEDIIG